MLQIYDLSQVPSWSEMASTTTLFIGAGAGPSHVIGKLSEVCIFSIFTMFIDNFA